MPFCRLYIEEYRGQFYWNRSAFGQGHQLPTNIKKYCILHQQCLSQVRDELRHCWHQLNKYLHYTNGIWDNLVKWQIWTKHLNWYKVQPMNDLHISPGAVCCCWCKFCPHLILSFMYNKINRATYFIQTTSSTLRCVKLWVHSVHMNHGCTEYIWLMSCNAQTLPQYGCLHVLSVKTPLTLVADQ